MLDFGVRRALWNILRSIVATLAVLVHVSMGQCIAAPKDLDTLFDDQVRGLEFPASPVPEQGGFRATSNVRQGSGWLGIKMASPLAVDDLPERYRHAGALIAQIVENSPAEVGGLRTGDVIISFANNEIESLAALKALIKSMRIHQVVDVDVWREGTIRRYPVKIGHAFEPPKPHQYPELELQSQPAAKRETPPVSRTEIVPNVGHFMSSHAKFSADGRIVVSGGDDGARVWDVTTGRLLRSFGQKVSGLAIHPDDATVLIRSNQTLTTWDIKSGRALQIFEVPTRFIYSPSFSPDGRFVIAGAQGMLLIWDAYTGKLLRHIDGLGGDVRALAMSRDNALLASGDNNGLVVIWNTKNGAPTFTMDVHDGPIDLIAFSGNGLSVVTASRDRFNIWNTRTGHLEHSKEGPIADAVLVGGDTVVALGEGGPLFSWNISQAALLEPLEIPPMGRQGRFDFSKDRRLAISSGKTLSLWDLHTQRTIQTFGTKSAAAGGIDLSNTQLLLHAEGSAFKLFDVATGQFGSAVGKLSGRIRYLKVTPDGGKFLTVSQQGALLWDKQSGVQVGSFGTNDSILAAALSPDGSHLLMSDFENVYLWNVPNMSLLHTFTNQPTPPMGLAFSPDGTKAAWGTGANGILEIWDVIGLKRLNEFQAGWSFLGQRVAFSPDGSHLVSTGDNFGRSRRSELAGEWRYWDWSTGELKKRFNARTPIESFAVTQDGKHVIAGHDNGSVGIYDIEAGAATSIMETGSGAVLSIRLSPDGTKFATQDQTAKLWRADTGELLVTFFTSAEDEWLALTPEGFFAASSGGAELLSIVRGLEVVGVDQLYQVLYRPDLVREKLSGDLDGKVRRAASGLNLQKLLDSGHAPAIEITSHRGPTTSDSDLITVSAQLNDRGGGIGRAEWRVNGITIGIVDKPTATLHKEVALDSGVNAVDLVVYNGANLVSSKPARLQVSWNGSEPRAPPRMHVLVAGINNYLDGSLRLNFAVPDAKAIAAALEASGRTHYDDVAVTYALDEKATVAVLDAIFTEVASTVRPRDVFVFFAAGHGKTVDGRYYLVPYDLRYQNEQSLIAHGIGQDKLQAWFARIAAKKSVLIFDTCEAGSLTARPTTRGGLEQKAALGRLIQATGRATLTASTATQEAFEGHGGHGLFTYAILDALARGDTNRNGLIELAELIQHVDGVVPAIAEKRWGAKQFPQMDAFGSNFSLARQVESLAPSQGNEAAVPTKPTHVNSEPLSVLRAVGKKRDVAQRLPPFSPVTVVRTEKGWALIARDGKPLGYVEASKLHRLN